MRKNTIDIITLGCSKNLVDSERLMRQLELSGYKVTHDSDDPRGEIAVVNTCGFIGDAKEESINMILELGERKRKGLLKKLYVMGCLSERYLADLESELPEVDHFYGKFNWTELLAELGKQYHPECADERHLTTPSHYAYLKISEGCDRRCSYCAIPIITGRHRSRPMEDILQEVRSLVEQGVKEFQVIAQELTYYGVDLYHERRIAQLVEAIAEVPGVEWVRLHYAYPTDFPMELLRVMREHNNICRYLDIALQHSADNVLSAMHRHVNSQQTYELIEKLRAEVPGIHIRTTLMVGHPGETEEDFKQLIMRVQQAISADVQESKVGQTMRVIIDRQEGDYFVGRTEFDSPEVDPEVLIHADEGLALPTGSFQWVRIDSADDFDLYGHCVDGPAD